MIQSLPNSSYLVASEDAFRLRDENPQRVVVANVKKRKGCVSILRWLRQTVHGSECMLTASKYHFREQRKRAAESEIGAHPFRRQ
jgi:hypothetical protein